MPHAPLAPTHIHIAELWRRAHDRAHYPITPCSRWLSRLLRELSQARVRCRSQDRFIVSRPTDADGAQIAEIHLAA